MPLVREISPAYIQNVRERLAAYIKSQVPSADTDPNTPFGDLMLTPLATTVASLEIAAGRMFSDLDLENVAQNKIYNCDFVRKFLRNFAVVERNKLTARGIVRLALDKDFVDTNLAKGPVWLDRGIQYVFGRSNIFTANLAFPGHIYLRFPNHVTER